MFELFKRKSYTHKTCLLCWLGGIFLAFSVGHPEGWLSFVFVAIGLFYTIVASLNLRDWSRKKLPSEWRMEMAMANDPIYDDKYWGPMTKDEFHIVVHTIANLTEQNQLK